MRAGFSLKKTRLLRVIQMTGSFDSITLSQLRNFHKLAETEHFTDAARQLFITQPTLSASIKALENELGVSLFYREGRRNVRLTKYGREFDADVSKILEDLENAVFKIKRTEFSECQFLNLGTIPTIQYDFLPGLLREVWDTYGYSYKIRITVEFSNPLIKALKEQQYELIFCAYVPEETDLTFIPMMHLPLVGVIHKDGPYKDFKSLSLSQLEYIPYTTYHNDTPIGRKTHKLLSKYPPPITRFDDEFMLSGAVSTDKNIVGIMLNTFEIEPFKNVKVVPIEEMPSDWHTICLAYDQRIKQSEFAVSFISAARSYAKRYA